MFIICLLHLEYALYESKTFVFLILSPITRILYGQQALNHYLLEEGGGHLNPKVRRSRCKIRTLPFLDQLD